MKLNEAKSIYDLKTIKRMDVEIEERIADSDGKPIAGTGTRKLAILYDACAISEDDVEKLVESGEYAGSDELLVLSPKAADRLAKMIAPHKAKPAPSPYEPEPVTRSAEYDRLVEKYFSPFGMLLRYWTRDEILDACAGTGLSERDLCEEMKVISEYRGQGHCGRSDAEYLRTGVESVREYDRAGREYLEAGRKRCNVYRVKNQYQGLRHGKVIAALLYARYPQLRKFGFKFYEYQDYPNSLPYEIYPEACNFYIPFEAMLSGDISAIIKRNEDYCKSYRFGEYTPEKHKERMESDGKVRSLLETIKSLPRRNN